MGVDDAMGEPVYEFSGDEGFPVYADADIWVIFDDYLMDIGMTEVFCDDAGAADTIGQSLKVRYSPGVFAHLL